MDAGVAGVDAETVVDALTTWSRFPVPAAVLVDVAETMAITAGWCRAGRADPRGCRGAGPGRWCCEASPWLISQSWRRSCGGSPWHRPSPPASVVVLPCGVGKTIVGAAAMAKVGAQTLILVTSTVAARQWRRELLDRTSLRPEEIGEYSGERKDVLPVTIATYQVLITKRTGQYPQLALFSALDRGLVVYDEVHLLPAPVFRMTAEIQSRRRLGLTATLVREDGRESDVFSLIGPKRFDAPWRHIEAQGWIAPARCVEVRVALTQDERMAYALAEPDVAYRVGSTAASKIAVVERVLAHHPGEPTLVIGQYIDQLERLAARLDAPLITGQTPTASARSCSTSSARAALASSSSPRWRTFRSTSPRHRSACRSLAPSAPAKRKRSASAASCGPRATAARGGSTRWSPATPTTRPSPPTASASWPSRATPTRSSTRPTCSRAATCRVSDLTRRASAGPQGLTRVQRPAQVLERSGQRSDLGFAGSPNRIRTRAST